MPEVVDISLMDDHARSERGEESLEKILAAEDAFDILFECSSIFVWLV